MMVINIIEYHAKEFGFYLWTPWRQRRFLNKEITRSNLPLKICQIAVKVEQKDRSQRIIYKNLFQGKRDGMN